MNCLQTIQHLVLIKNVRPTGPILLLRKYYFQWFWLDVVQCSRRYGGTGSGILHSKMNFLHVLEGVTNRSVFACRREDGAKYG
jgi:hypothetical protein